MVPEPGQVQCRLCEGFRSVTDSALIDHLRMDHPLAVQEEELPTDVNYTDATYEKARRMVHRWRSA
jgi:hypothetical protein